MLVKAFMLELKPTKMSMLQEHMYLIEIIENFTPPYLQASKIKQFKYDGFTTYKGLLRNINKSYESHPSNYLDTF